jgi:UDP-N-acetylglucosamine 4,6-dehydratase
MSSMRLLNWESIAISMSSHKAVNPINLFGASRICADKLFISTNAFAGSRPDPRFSVVRCGTLLDSCSGIVSHWKKLLAQGVTELPISDLRVTRFWMTLQ